MSKKLPTMLQRPFAFMTLSLVDLAVMSAATCTKRIDFDVIVDSPNLSQLQSIECASRDDDASFWCCSQEAVNLELCIESEHGEVLLDESKLKGYRIAVNMLDEEEEEDYYLQKTIQRHNDGKPKPSSLLQPSKEIAEEGNSQTLLTFNCNNRRKLQVTGALDWPHRQYDDDTELTASSPTTSPLPAVASSSDSLSQVSFDFMPLPVVVLAFIGFLLYALHWKKKRNQTNYIIYNHEEKEDGSLTSDNSGDSDLELVEAQ